MTDGVHSVLLGDMAADLRRRRNLPSSPSRPAELSALIEAARSHVMSPREVWLQRVSFAFGMLPEESTITREQIEATATEMYGPCPPEPPAQHVPACPVLLRDLCGPYGMPVRPLEVPTTYRDVPTVTTAGTGSP